MEEEEEVDEEMNENEDDSTAERMIARLLLECHCPSF